MAEPKGLVDVLKESADRAFAGIGEGVDTAGAALAAPEAADLAPLLAAVDLPELPGEGPLGAISVRLDREADLLRGIALRELARVGWMGRIAQTVVVVAGVAEIGVGLAAAVSAFLSSEARGGQYLLAAMVMACAAAIVVVGAQLSRNAHAALARDALDRARRIEDRIFRVAIAMEWRTGGAALFQDALARLERDGIGSTDLGRDPANP